MNRVILGILLALSACTGRKYDDVSDRELSERAQQLPLEGRYALYMDVYKNSSPHRISLARDIAALGDPAWNYTLGLATRGDYYSGLKPALPVLAAFDRTCRPSDYQLLIGAARRVAHDRSQLRSAVGRIRVACNYVHSATLEDFEKDLNEVCRELDC